MTPVLVSLVFCLTGALPQSSREARSYQGKERRPPSLHMLEDSSAVMVARTIDVTERGVGFSVRKLLVGDASGAVVLELDRGTADHVTVGKDYVVGILDAPPVRFPGTPRPDSASVVLRVPGLGEAVVPHSEAMEAFLQSIASQSQDFAEIRRSVLAGLGSVEPLAQRFFAAELTARRRLHGELGSEDLSLIAALAGNPEADPAAKEMLLAYGERFGDTSEWRVQVARAVLADEPRELDFASYVPSLVRTSINIVASDGAPGDAGLIRPWLTSNHPGVITTAAEALLRLSPETIEEDLSRAAGRADLAPAARSALARFARRLERAKEREKSHENP